MKKHSLLCMLYLLLAPIASFAQSNKVIKDCAECPEMVVVPAGSFVMGDNSSANVLIRPEHKVTFKYSFAIGKTEITQAQWKAVMGSNPSIFKKCGDNCPVENVSWKDVQDFAKKLSAKTGAVYRLPTEAEWEYSCRAGERYKFCGSNNLSEVATLTGEKGGTYPVAKLKPNAWGIYDMSGNVSEWTADAFNSDYKNAPVDGSSYLPSKADMEGRVMRMGAFSFTVDMCYATERFGFKESGHGAAMGARLVRQLP